MLDKLLEDPIKFVEFWGNLFVKLAEPKHMHEGWSLIMMPRKLK